ncbi:MAG TPA: hypothetical protein DGT23_07080 [Micromonosporaceae bacterium]|nr:hypothetical protein [Micromonosporaceae bacterium]
MPKGFYERPASPIGTKLPAVIAFAGVLLLMAFSAICLRAGNPTLATAAGTAAIGLTGWAVQYLVRAAVPESRDDDGLPPAADRSAPAEVDQ